MANNKAAEHLVWRGANDVTELSPMEQLATAIFIRAFLDCQSPSRHNEIRRFARSRWATILLCGAVSPDWIADRFEEVIKLYA